MKKLFFLLAPVFCSLSAAAQVKMPAPSPTEFIRQDFALGTVELTYSRPSLRGRQMIGVVEPWGSLWRTGANAATKIRFTDEVEIEGHKIDSGSYALYTIPNKNGNWIFILNKGANNSGTTGYKESDDVLRITTRALKNAQKVETLSMYFSDIKPESCSLNISWEDFTLRIPIVSHIKDRIRTALEEAMKQDKKPYWQAAQFYYEWDKNYPKALEMANAAFAEMPNPPYFMVFYKARIQKDAGDKKGALETAKKAYDLAKAVKNENYMIMSQQMIKELQ